MISFLARELRRLASFAQDRHGVSAVEFAIVLPVMLGLYLGSVEVTQGISAKRKVTLAAHTVADLTSRYTSVDNADMTNILNAATAVIAPYPSSGLKVTVSEIAIDSSGQATVAWSDTLNGTALTVGQAVTVPAALAVPNSYLILGQAQYSYDPSYGYVLTDTLTLNEQFFMRPRQSTSIARTDS